MPLAPCDYAICNHQATEDIQYRSPLYQLNRPAVIVSEDHSAVPPLACEHAVQFGSGPFLKPWLAGISLPQSVHTKNVFWSNGTMRSPLQEWIATPSSHLIDLSMFAPVQSYAVSPSCHVFACVAAHAPLLAGTLGRTFTHVTAATEKPYRAMGFVGFYPLQRRVEQNIPHCRN
jgi:hypothetical protein